MKRRLEIGSHITKLFNGAITVSSVNPLAMRSRKVEVKATKKRISGGT